MRFWIIAYHHRHGIDIMPMFQEERPKHKDIIEQYLKDEFEEDREDEYLDTYGPYDTPAGERNA